MNNVDFKLRDVIYIILIFGSALATYYINKGNTQTEIAVIKNDIKYIKEDVTEIKDLVLMLVNSD